MKIQPLLKKLFLGFLGSDGNPFSIVGSMWPPDAAGKYIIQSEGIRLAFVKRGGALANLWINDTKCNEIDVVLGLDNSTQYDSYLGNPTLNGVIGRYAGLIGGASFEFEGIRHQTPRNAKDKKSTMHGGNKGWGQMMLHPASHSANSVTFVVFDRRGRNGFPGTAVSSVTHTVTPYEWRIAFGVTPVMATTPISLSQQVFWNLDGFATGSTQTISDHNLKLPFSGLRLDTDEDGVPTGDIKGNRINSTFDFWSGPKSLMDSLDHTFLVNRAQPWSMYTAPVASLASAHSGITLDIFTDQEAVHAVTWAEEPGSLMLKSTQGPNPVPRHAAISLQMQDWTDAVNHPEWQRDDKIFWGTDRLYTTYSSYKFSVKRKETCG